MAWRLTLSCGAVTGENVDGGQEYVKRKVRRCTNHPYHRENTAVILCKVLAVDRGGKTLGLSIEILGALRMYIGVK